MDHVDNEGEKIYEMFETAPPHDRRPLFYALEGNPWSGSLEDSGNDLWKNLEDGQRARLKQLLDKSP